MSSFWKSAKPAASEPLSEDMLIRAFDALVARDRAERERRNQPGYCQHQDLILHPQEARAIDGTPCPWCGRTLHSPPHVNGPASRE